MKRKFPLGLALAAMVLASPVAAAAIDEMDTVASEDMDRLRGGTEATEVVQGNVSNTQQTNVSEGIVIANGSSKTSGSIGTATITGNHGIVSQMINSGDNNIMNAGTNINIYMK